MLPGGTGRARWRRRHLVSKKKRKGKSRYRAGRSAEAQQVELGTAKKPDPMDADQDKILARRKDVWEQRLAGFTVREISAALKIGVATVHRDLEAVRLELDDRVMQLSEVERAIGAGRLDRAARSLMSTIELIEDPGQLSTVANALARIEERRSKLLGLDKPYETIVHTTAASPEEARRLMAEKFGRTARQSTDSADNEQDDPAHEQT